MQERLYFWRQSVARPSGIGPTNGLRGLWDSLDQSVIFPQRCLDAVRKVATKGIGVYGKFACQGFHFAAAVEDYFSRRKCHRQ